LRERPYAIAIATGRSKVHPQIAAIGPTKARKRSRERRDATVFVAPQEHANAPHAVALLCARRERPSRRAAESSDEFAPSKANAHLPLLCRETYEQTSTVQACSPG
jgi:hypothetical protein